MNAVDHATTTQPRDLVWAAGLLVAIGAGVATAHGLYQVAAAAGVPKQLAWLYPLITDGLALVAYATTTQLGHHGRRYAWTVVVTAAGVSGLTQAGYLAGGFSSAPAVLRFAIGAWPALAAAIVAHLLFLLRATSRAAARKRAAAQASAADAASRAAAEAAGAQTEHDRAARLHAETQAMHREAEQLAAQAAALRTRAEADRDAAHRADHAPPARGKTVPVPARKRWIRAQLEAGNPVTGAAIDKRYGTTRTGARLLAAVQAEIANGL